MVYGKNIEVSEPIHRELKVIAAQKGKPLKEYVTEILQLAINRDRE